MASHIAYEISSLLATSGSRGEKSGIFRLLNLRILDNPNRIYLFSLYPDLLDNQKNNKSLSKLLQNPNINLVNIYPFTIPINSSPFSFYIRKTIRFIYRKLLGEKWINIYQNNLQKYFINNNIKKVVHGESTYFPVKKCINSITINDLIPIKFSHLCQPKTITDAKRRLEFAQKYCDEVICISENTKKDLLEYWDKPRNGQVVKVVYPSSKPLTNQIANLPTLQTTITSPYFLAYGTYEPRKNYLMLCKLFIKLKKENKLKGYKLVLAGGRGWGGVWEEVSKMKDPIIQLGYVSDEGLASLIKNAKAVLYPTLYEGYGFPVVESHALGTHVYCSNNSSLSEICKDNCTLVEEGEWEKVIKNQVQVK